jgi:starch phosphorylase
MKFMLNGAMTLGTLDGANIEIAEEAGKDNEFIFGLTVDEVAKLREDGYDPREYYESDPFIKEVLDLVAEGHFSPDEPARFQPLTDALLSTDFYLHLADFESYRRAHLAVDETYANREKWMRMSIANIANAGKFSSDRTIKEYATDIWKVPVPKG